VYATLRFLSGTLSLQQGNVILKSSKWQNRIHVLLIIWHFNVAGQCFQKYESNNGRKFNPKYDLSFPKLPHLLWPLLPKIIINNLSNTLFF
jgi:hypothetical protein